MRHQRLAEDILRGKPAFAIAANLPRRGGPTQLNHLVAATFAQGAAQGRLPLCTSASAADRLEGCRGTGKSHGGVKIGFPEMKISDELVCACGLARPRQLLSSRTNLQSKSRQFRSAPSTERRQPV